jgi:hypothetical protein
MTMRKHKEVAELATVEEFIAYKIMLIDPRIKLHPCRMEFPKDLSREQWRAIGTLLNQLGPRCAW